MRDGGTLICKCIECLESVEGDKPFANIKEEHKRTKRRIER